MHFPTVTGVGLNPSAMVGIRYAGSPNDARQPAPHLASRWRGFEHVIAAEGAEALSGLTPRLTADLQSGGEPSRSMGAGAGALGLREHTSWGLSLSLSPAVVFSRRRVGNEAGMSISEPGLTGRQQLAAISRSMAGLQREHYGRESTKVNAYAINDMIVVVVRLKQLTPLEKSMVDGGEPERVLALRAEFARVMAGRYTHRVDRSPDEPSSRCLADACGPRHHFEAFFLDRRFGSKITDGWLS